MTGQPPPGAPKRPRGHRLANPRDPAVIAALRTHCPVCPAKIGQWCIGVSGGLMKGRQLSRIHVARCTFKDML